MQNEISTYFDQYSERILMRVYTKEHEEIFVVDRMSDKKDSHPIEVGIFELGQSVIDFLYDPNYEAIVATLLDSDRYVAEIQKNPEDLMCWMPFYCLLQNAQGHFFYRYLLQEIVNAYKDKLRKPDGKPYSADYFCKIGYSYQRLRKQIQTLVGACFEETAKDGASANDRYIKQFPGQALSFGYVVGEPIPAKPYKEGEPMAYKMAEVLHPKSPEDIGSFLFLQYLKENILFKRCENCQKYFVATGRSNVKYCDRMVSGTDRTCRQIAPLLTFREKRKDSPAEKVFNRAYKTQHSRMSAGKMSKEIFKEWSKDARQKRDECAAGKITVEDFERWLSYGE